MPATVGRGAAPTAGRSPAPPPVPKLAKQSGRGAVSRAPQPAVRARRGGRLRTIWASGQLLAFLGALVCGAAVAYLLTAGALTAQELAIDGAGATGREQIASASGVMGHNIFTIDPQAVAERLIALPTVREAQVWSELPGRLVVRIAERQPTLLWQVGEERFLLDGGGFVIGANPAGAATQSLPRVVARDIPAPQVGGRIDAAPLAAAQLIAARAADSGLPLGTIEYAPSEGLALALPAVQGTTAKRIVLGTDARLEEKLAAAGAVLRADGGWTVLNVTDPDRPFFPAR